MRSAGRAIAESFVLHGLLAVIMIAIAGAFTPPPPTIRLDFCMLEQAAALAPIAEAPQKAAVGAPVPTPPMVSPTPPGPKPVSAKIKPAHPKPIRPKTSEVAAVVPTPTPEPAALPGVEALTEEAPSGVETSANTGQATLTNSAMAATAGAGNHGQIATVSGAGYPAGTVEEYRRANFGAIRDSILGNLRYPVLARRQGWSGQVEVAFMIAPDGSIDELRIQTSSGFTVLDDQALAAIRRSAPFIPAPRIAALLVVPVTFQLN